MAEVRISTRAAPLHNSLQKSQAMSLGITVELPRPRHSYEIRVGSDLLARTGATARAAVPTARRVALISNAKVWRLYGAAAQESLENAGLRVHHWLMGDGERHKNWRTLERALDFLLDLKLERGDAVAALGGGVTGDLAGCAAAIYLRGVPFIQIPTTLLAQIDSSVGGKTGINSRHGKNLIGVFHQPATVVIDTATLGTLPRRELTAGWCEAVKQGAAGDAALFTQTYDFLAQHGPTATDAPQLAQLIAAQCAFKARIVAGDEREDATRTDARSRRILNFGHTIGHALEAVTNYRRLRHGEAVGYGMLAAGELAKRLALFNETELQSLRQAVKMCGKLPRITDISAAAVISALAADKKSVGGHVKWILPEQIGQSRIVDGRAISPQLLKETLATALALS